jgi:hypothetical protein
MPTDQRLGLEDFQRAQNSGSQAVEPGKQEAIQVAEGYPLWAITPQHIELVSKDEDFSLQRSPRPEQADYGTPHQAAEIAHGDRLFRRVPARVLSFR